jgi:N-dimethylarginine dimethylaminohydrolase
MLDGVVLVTPEQFKVVYSLNPLTNLSSSVDPVKAHEQYERLKARFTDRTIPVYELGASATNSENRFPDLVFVSNSAMFLRGWPRRTCILARYAKKQRQGEEQLIKEYFEPKGVSIYELPKKDGLYFEGQGDCRWSHDGKHLWFAYGAGRSTLSGIQAVEELILQEAASQNWVPPTFHHLRIVNRNTYHMDLCFLPLPNGRILYHKSSFSKESQNEVERVFGETNVVNVPNHYLYGCNSVILNQRDLLIPKLANSGSTIGFRQWMRKHSGMHIEETNVNEFELAGGSVSCLVLPVWSLV